MERKKIGVLIGSVTNNFSSRICRTISEKADEYGYDVCFFVTFNSHGDNLLYGEGEHKIFSLPDYSKFSGVIVAMDTLNTFGGEAALIKRLNGLPCPVVALREAIPGAYNVMVDENVSMEQMIRHFIDVHHFRDICFMTGRMELEDARLRYDCYKRVMEENGIEVTDDMVFFGDYWKTKAKEAVDHFISGRLSKYPQAIVCANDYMAISICRELGERGIRVPEDISVISIDGINYGKVSVPSLTTVHVDKHTMINEALQMLTSLIKGETCSSHMLNTPELDVGESTAPISK